MKFFAAAAILFVALPARGQTPAYPTCAAVRVDDTGRGTIIGAPADRVTWARTGVFVNGLPVADVCGVAISPPFPLPKDVPTIEVTVAPGQYFVAWEVSTGIPRPTPTAVVTVMKGFGLLSASCVTGPTVR